ncbi:MAG: PilT/PilU family type 4a pilus ATPase [Phycisphaerae bacterium]|nr:PilT/PilU family type 4a pilus ATPase [Phycisphaerae bacterium]
MDLKEVLRFAVEHEASDVHIQASAPPMMRIAGQVRSVEGRPLTNDEALAFVASIAPTTDGGELDTRALRRLDFSYEIQDLSRFRCSVYSHLGQVGVVMRVIPREVPSLESLNLPQVLHDVALVQRGLTLLTGPSGSGKSTTLAAMVDLINTRRSCKILVVEDPVEYVHASKKSLISQLEVGADTPSFAEAMKRGLRQDPDVIVIGELRDLETVRLVLHAAATGRQVLACMPSGNAVETIELLIGMFPAGENRLLAGQLAGALEAVVSQRLVTTGQATRSPAVEILRGNVTTMRLILENRLDELKECIQTGQAKMQSFDQSLLRMYERGVISGTEALRCASNPEALSVALREVKRA